MWWDNLPNQVQELMTGKRDPNATTNWWDEIALAIAEALFPFVNVLPPADTTAMTKALNDLQEIAATQNPAP